MVLAMMPVTEGGVSRGAITTCAAAVSWLRASLLLLQLLLRAGQRHEHRLQSRMQLSCAREKDLDGSCLE